MIRYPAAGKNNVAIKLGLVSPADGNMRWIYLGEETDVYLARVDWLPDSKHLSYQLEQRNQQQLDLKRVDVASLEQQTLLTERSNTWINLSSDLRFLDDGSFIWASERSGYLHLYRYDRDGTLMHPISKGNWKAVSSCVSWARYPAAQRSAQ